MKEKPDCFKTAPVVFAVEDNYQIMVPVSCETLMWVQIGDKCFYDHVNGVMRSHVRVHRMIVPQELLDAAKEYTICFRRVIERKHKYTESMETESATYAFKPIETPTPRFYHLADAHSEVEAPIAFGKAAMPFDFLVLNGDIPHNSDSTDTWVNVFTIAAELTNSELPVVFIRGNHDMRGAFAEFLTDDMPCADGKFYYTARLGSLNCLILDCGEDKCDAHEEYAHTICCDALREDETKWLEKLAASGFKADLVFSHIPFEELYEDKFNPAEPTYRRWCRILSDDLNARYMFCGHVHAAYVVMPEDEINDFGLTFPCIVAAMSRDYEFGGGVFTINPDLLDGAFIHDDGSRTEFHV